MGVFGLGLRQLARGLAQLQRQRPTDRRRRYFRKSWYLRENKSFRASTA